MNREEIIRMAREANIKQAIETPHLLMVPELERFAALVAAAEREACAKVCEEQITGKDYQYLANHGHWDHMAQSAKNCAAAIRARGQA